MSVKNYKKMNGEQPLSLGQQLGVMKQCFPKFKLKCHKNYFVFTGPIQPTVMSEIYTVQITCIVNGGKINPSVCVLSPKLNKGPDGKSIPHMYPNEKLCLYLPKRREFTSCKYIAKTIVPWTSLWLYYYELWHMTGKWLGGGEHPPLGKCKNKKLTSSKRRKK